MTGRPLGPLTWSLSVGRGAGLWAGALGGGTDVRRTCVVPGTQPSSSLASGCQKERPPCLSPLSLLSTSSSGPGAVPAPGSRPGGGSTSGEGRVRRTPALHVIPWLTPHRTAGPAQPSPQSRLLLYPFFAPGHGQPAATGRSGSGEYEEMPARGPGGGHETHFTYAATSGPAVFSVSRGTRLATPLTPEDCRSQFGDFSNMRSWPFGV